MHYYQIDNPGIKDWITHEDNQTHPIVQYPPNIWVTENTEWAERVGAAELTKEQAQTVSDIYVDELRVEWEACMSGSQPETCGPEPPYFILP